MFIINQLNQLVHQLLQIVFSMNP